MPSVTRKNSTRGKSGNLDQRLIKAMSHPLRMQILTRLDGKVASPREMSEQIGESLGRVSYHVRILADMKLIELVRTEPRRGATEHFYRGLERPFLTGQTWPEIPPQARRSVSGVVLSDIWTDITRSLDNELFDARDDRHLSRVPLVLDQQGWDNIRDLLADALDGVLAEQARSAARMVEDPDSQSIAAETAMIYFETAPKSRRNARSKG